MYQLWLLSPYKGRDEQLQQGPYGLRSLKYLLTDSFRKKFADPCFISLEKLFYFFLGVFIHFTKAVKDAFDVECGRNIKHLVPKPTGFEVIQIRISTHHLMTS